MTSTTKLTIRPLPHLDFIAGFPGIPGDASRTSAHITGNIEVRLGSRGAKASFLRIELRKLESVAGGETWGEVVGRGPTVVWSARPGPGAGDREEDAEGSWETLQTADFPFRIPIPEGLPPTAKLDKQCGISYELVTSLCVKGKKGLLRSSPTSSIVQSTHPIALEKHELHSTWPIYHISDEHSDENDGVKARVERTQTCYGPGDTVTIKVFVYSTKVAPVKLKSVAFSVRETITFRGGGSKTNRLSSFGGGGAAASQRTETLAQKSKTYGKKMYKDEEQEFILTCQIPKSHSLMTIQTAKHIEVSYTMRIYVDVSKAPIIIDHLPLTITTFPSAQSRDVCNRIGFVQGLSRNNYTDDAYSTVISDRQSAIGHTGHSLSSRPPAVQRSQSYGSSGAGTDGGGGGGGIGRYGVGSDLRRRDTVMTQGTAISGPGMAGRGVPGQLFSWGDMGAAQAYSHDGPGPIRPKFAGPPSIYERPELNAEESRAMFHSANMSENAARLGVSSEALSGPGVYAAGSGNQSRFNLQRSPFEAISESTTPNPHASPTGSPAPGAAGAALAAQQAQLLRYASANASRQSMIRRPQSAGASAVSEAPSDTAEQEKMRLYQRAREQAERNQRRADEKRKKQAAVLSQSSNNNVNDAASSATVVTSSQSAGAIAALSAANLAAAQTSRNVSAPVPGSTAYNNAANEKARLYERARKEAERYQSGFEQGATFPKEALEGYKNGFAQGSSASLSHAAPTASGTNTPSRLQPGSMANDDEDRRRSSAAYWMGENAATSAATASRANISASAERARAASAATPKPPGSWLTAEEEKGRLYETAKAQQAAAEAEARMASHSPPALGATSLDTPAAASSISNSGPKAPMPSYLSAEEEKRRLYERAKAEQAAAEADAKVRSEMLAQGGASSARSGLSAPTDDLSSARAPAAAPRDEKAQLRLYYEAQDAVARGQHATALGPAQSSGVAGTQSAPTHVPNPHFSLSNPGDGDKAQPYQPYETAPVPTYHQATASETQLPSASTLSTSSAASNYVNNRQTLHANAFPHSAGVSPLSTPPALNNNAQRSSYVVAPSSSQATSNGSRAPPPSAPSQPNPGAGAVSEKEQMKLYYAARDAQLQAENEAAAAGASLSIVPSYSSPSGQAASSVAATSSAQPGQAQYSTSSAGPALTRPAASYAPGFTRPGETAAQPVYSSSGSSAQQTRPFSMVSHSASNPIASAAPMIGASGASAGVTSVPQTSGSSGGQRPMSMANYRPLPDTVPNTAPAKAVGNANMAPSFANHAQAAPVAALELGTHSYGSITPQRLPSARTSSAQIVSSPGHDRLASDATSLTSFSDLPHHDPSISAGKQRSLRPHPPPFSNGFDGLSQLNTTLPKIDFGSLSPLELRAGVPTPPSSGAQAPTTGVSSPPTSSIYSPRYAQHWDDDDEPETPRAVSAGNTSSSAPPPLPPKTRIG
ncbi:Immunoglobulin E-set [Ceraceosorus bombacis]|uniref:Immunoglobulin E-set n=1 Tax=Ceraceosorus bombacis TaxID=401625 RepID=A0A0P1BLW6_9BASI|nr:Immunoglobulin E-set [Ceraceosorus bombacis]